jgi:hypothetical protein
MSPAKRELKETLRFGIKTLILQEVRILRLERSFTPHILLEAESHSVQETKGEIVKLAQGLSEKERAVLLRKMVREIVDEEIDRAIELRKNRCLRCLHIRYYDREGIPRSTLPVEASQPQPFGCEALPPGLKKKCNEFVETSMAMTVEDYLNEMTLLYEFKEIFDRIQEVWKDYFTK